ncbi:MAG: hypothetical protein ABI305_02220 [Tepidiformaceae bacterium]
MEEVLCGAKTNRKTDCKWPAKECPHHQGGPSAGRDAPREAPPPAADRLSQPRLPGAIGEHDLRGLGWWVIGETLRQALDPRSGSVVVSVMRVLAALGPEPLAEEEALKEVELRGRVMNGQAPRDASEWERAERTFDEHALAEFRRWERPLRPLDELLLEGDGGDGHEPLFFGDGTAHE